MKVLYAFLFMSFALGTHAQTSFEVMAETKYLYTTLRQVVGLSYNIKHSSNTLFVGYDNAFSNKRNIGVGYQFSYTLDNGIGLDANLYGRFGEFFTGSADVGGGRLPCLGTFVLEEAIGIHYQFKKKFLNHRLVLTPFVRISFAQGFDQEEEIPNTNFILKCEVPLRDVSWPYIGLRYSYKL